MKVLKVFSFFALLHIAAWAGAHTWMSANKSQILLVADTSYSMKPHFPAVQRWIEDFQSTGRYQSISMGTDKAKLGDLTDIRSKESIFRTAFGKLSEDSLVKYRGQSYDRKILLSDGTLSPSGWELVVFD